jgi:DNA-binding transcriptional MerR regulator
VTDVLIHEVCGRTNLTKKAVEYYTGKGLVVPEVLENGYRDYAEEDVERLRRIGILRRLGLGMEEIGEILRDGSGEALRRAALRWELQIRRNARRGALLWGLNHGRTYEEVEGELRALEMEEAIGERLIAAFPGFFGRFVCMHFSEFLREPVRTKEQQEAFEEVRDFLDGMPSFEVPEDVEEVMSRGVESLDTEKVGEILDGVRQSLQDPEAFLREHQETVEWYLAYRQPEEYQNSAAARWMEGMRSFQSASGYTDVFLPAMRRLSPSYREYCEQLEAANKRFLERYPEAGEM